MDLRLLLRAGLFVLSLVATGAGAHAACVNPAGEAGEIAYNYYYQTMQHCNGSNWIGWARPAPENYVPTAARFDGTNDYIRRTSNPNEVNSAATVTGSFWVKRGATGANQTVFAINDHFFFGINSSGNFLIEGERADGTDILQVTTTGALLNNTNWNHVIFSIDMANSSANRVYINGSAATLSYSLNSTGNSFGFVMSPVTVGSYHDGSIKLNGSLSDLWVETGLFVDLTVAANREKFRSSTGLPRWLGADGSLPFGNKPDFFFSGPFNNWYQNKGTAGSFTLPNGQVHYNIPMNGEGPAGCATVGATCAGGMVYAGYSVDGNVPLFTTAADAPTTMAWNSGTLASVHVLPENCFTDSVMGSEVGCLTGQYNTSYLASLHGRDGASYDAAAYCDSLSVHGYDDWYLPSQGELETLYRNRSAIGGTSAQLYWSSSDSHLVGDANGVNFATGMHFRTDMDEALRVRCVRKGSCAAPYGAAGALVYNADSRVLQWCDGQQWRAAGPVSPTSATSGCIDPAGTAGVVLYHSSNRAMQYCDGGAWQKVVVADPCDQPGASAGTACADGTIYVGLSPADNTRMFAAASNEPGTFQWGPGGNSSVEDCVPPYPGTGSGCRTGHANTSVLAGLGASYAAGHACASSTAHGYDDWYLPALQEYDMLYQIVSSLGVVPTTTHYWTSSEVGATATSDAWHISMGGGSTGHNSKTNNYFVRCVRKR